MNVATETETPPQDKDKKEKKDKPKKEKKGKGKGKKDKKAKKDRIAAKVDKYDLYQKAVQNPDADIDFFTRVFEKHFERTPRLLAEDFCGTALTASEWVKKHPENKVWGTDLDPVPLAWGREHNLGKLSQEERSRVTLIEGNVLDARPAKVDVVAAQNFSYCIFKTRDALREYFRAARAALKDEGILVLDLFGGPEAQTPQKEGTEDEEEGFTYWWHQKDYDPINNGILCHIHFEFPDKSKLKKAFTYDWRLWTIPELRELMLEAGFSQAECWWDATDDEDDDDYQRAEKAETYEAWIAYVVGVR